MSRLPGELIKRLPENHLLSVASIAIVITAHAQSTTFTFGSNNGGGESQMALDGLAAGFVTVNGLTLTASANTGTFNSTATAGFGINNTGTDSTPLNLISLTLCRFRLTKP